MAVEQLGAHRGARAPSVDTCTLAPPSPYGRTYTSLRPDLSDWYATHSPSGENRADLSLNEVVRNGSGLRSPSSGSIQMSLPFSGLVSVNATTEPSGAIEVETLSRSLVNSGSVSTLPSTRVQNSSNTRCSEAYTTRSPSGIQ